MNLRGLQKQEDLRVGVLIEQELLLIFPFLENLKKNFFKISSFVCAKESNLVITKEKGVKSLAE